MESWAGGTLVNDALREVLDGRTLVSLDTETFLIEPGLLAPPCVCASVASWAPGGNLCAWLVAPGEERLDKIRLKGGVLDVAEQYFASAARTPLPPFGGTLLAFANAPYDIAVLAAEDLAAAANGERYRDVLGLAVEACLLGNVHDVLRAQELHAIAEGNLGQDPRTGGLLARTGRYSLDLVTSLVLGREDAKSRDSYRTRYGILADVPIEDWPPEALEYPLDDAKNTWLAAAAQLAGGGAGATPGPHKNLEDMAAQVSAHLAAHLGAVWGLRSDKVALDVLVRRAQDLSVAFRRRHASFFKKSDGKEDGKAVRTAVARAYGSEGTCAVCRGGGDALSVKSGNKVVCKACSGTGLHLSPSVPLTPGGGVAKGKDALLESGDPDLVAYAENQPEKILSTYALWLAGGIDRPITLRPNPILASLRMSYGDVTQTMPRNALDRPDDEPWADGSPDGLGVRECLVPRSGFVFASVDYAAIELCTLAQICLWTVGQSSIADAIIETDDPGSLHTMLGAELVGEDFEVFRAKYKAEGGSGPATFARWSAKAKNFGGPGGMGDAKFVESQRRPANGETIAPDGKKYPGLRFCILLGGAARCGIVKTNEWNNRDVPALCVACLEIASTVLTPRWRARWDEIKPYWRWVSDTLEATGGVLPLLTPGPDGARATCYRGGLDFTSGANTGFQTLAARGAKAALRAAMVECWLGKRLVAGAWPGDPERVAAWAGGKSSPLHGSRVVFAAHDEFVAEVPLSCADEATERLEGLMVAHMRRYVPDVPVKVESALSLRWSKRAKSKRVNGKSVPWDLEIKR